MLQLCYLVTGFIIWFGYFKFGNIQGIHFFFFFFLKSVWFGNLFTVPKGIIASKKWEQQKVAG